MNFGSWRVAKLAHAAPTNANKSSFTPTPIYHSLSGEKLGSRAKLPTHFEFSIWHEGLTHDECFDTITARYDSIRRVAQENLARPRLMVNFGSRWAADG